jgi:predicted SprT family Zn-dependent metalloprotease
MHLAKAQTLANELMAEHGLKAKGWYFSYDNAVRRFGACHYSTKRITLSSALTQLNDEDKVRTVILHEIAHALAGRKAHHNNVWKAICRSIGGDGQTYYSVANTVTPDRKVIGTCPNCSRVIKRHRRANIACGKCCNQLNGGKYDEKYKIVWA